VAAQETDSETSEMSPINPPAHLQQLFDNDFVDTQATDAMSSNVGSDRISNALLSKVRSRLQALMPSKEDVRIICEPSMKWISIYASLFPTMNKFNSAEDILGQYDLLCGPDANPLQLAGLLLSVAITIVQQPAIPTSSLTMTDPLRWVRSVNDTIDDTVVRNDSLVCTMEGIETTLLYLRL
jgi:hypothetical protein